MTSRNRYTFYLDDADRGALTAVKKRDGISESEQIRRAIKAWVGTKDVKKSGRQRTSTRKRS